MTLPSGITQCMLCQKRVFVCTEKSGAHPVEDGIEERGVFVLAVEVSFGPKHCPRARQQCVYFDVLDQDSFGFKVYNRYDDHLRLPLAVLNTGISLPMYRYSCQTSYNIFVQNVVRAQIFNMNGNQDKMVQQARTLQRNMEQWQWPVTTSRNIIEVTEDTLDPPVDEKYQVSNDFHFAAKIWGGFVEESKSERQTPNHNQRRCHGFPRLLTDEEMKSEEDSHVFTGSSELASENVSGRNSFNFLRSERCWRSLLLNDGPGDWGEIQARFADFM